MIIFNDYGIQIEKKNDRFFILYDSGGIASHLDKIEVTETDANLAQRNEDEAYNVIIKYQNKK